MLKVRRQPSLTDEIPYLRKMARLTTGNAADADDLVQETLLKAMTKIDSFQGGASLRTWLTSIMINTHRSDRRRAAVRAEYLAHQSPADLERAQSVPARQEDRLEVLQTLDALSTLPDEQRLAIAAVAGGHMSYSDAAKAMNVKLGTFMSRISRGRSALRRRMEGQDNIDEKEISGDRYNDENRKSA